MKPKQKDDIMGEDQTELPTVEGMLHYSQAGVPLLICALSPWWLSS